MSKIRTKIEMYRLFGAGKFGNKTREWREFDWYLRSGFPGLVALRQVGNPGGLCTYNLTQDEAVQEREKWISLGIHPDEIQVSEMLPGKRIQFAGEVMQSDRFYDLFFYRKPGLHMRDGLRLHGQHAYGFQAATMLNHYMDTISRENLTRLFDEYPGHVVEFSCCSIAVGTMGWNTVFWEVRDY